MTCRGAVVFDLDGTLIDSAPDLLATMNLLLAEKKRRPISLTEIVPMIGDGIPPLLERALSATGATPSPTERVALLSRFLDLYLDPTRPQLTRIYADVSAVLARIKDDGFRLAVCTNKVEGAAVRLLEQLGLADAFDAVVGGDTVPAKKPDPRHVLATLERLGIPSYLAVTVGDSQNDLAAGAAAGTATVAVTYGYGNVAEAMPRPSRVIERFRDLPEVLDALIAERTFHQTEHGK